MMQTGYNPHMVIGQRTAHERTAVKLDGGYMYYEKEQRKRKITITTCENCEKDVAYDVRRSSNEGWYCSTDCYNIKNGNYVYCDHCGDRITRSKSSQGRFNFCNRGCKESEQTVGGLLELPHYKDGLRSYRRRAINYYGQMCDECDETINHRLIVHHIDGNRHNNGIENLIVLCHNHHSDRHAKNKDGRTVLDYKIMDVL